MASATRGLAYLASGRGQDAAGEFTRIIERPGVDPLSVLNALARVGLARAAAMAGNRAASRAAYQDFFALWKDADPDVAILVQARREYEQVK